MRDPYLYDDVDILKNLANIKDHDLLSRAEADITNLSMLAVYHQSYKVFDTKTLQDIHSNIFGQIYDWAGEFRTIQIAKYEDVLGGRIHLLVFIIRQVCLLNNRLLMAKPKRV